MHVFMNYAFRDGLACVCVCLHAQCVRASGVHKHTNTQTNKHTRSISPHARNVHAHVSATRDSLMTLAVSSL